MSTMTRINGTLQLMMLGDVCHERGDRRDHTAVAVFDMPADFMGRC